MTDIPPKNKRKAIAQCIPMFVFDAAIIKAKSSTPCVKATEALSEDMMIGTIY